MWEQPAPSSGFNALMGSKGQRKQVISLGIKRQGVEFPILVEFSPPHSERVVLQEAAQGTKKKVDLSKVMGTQIPPVEIEIPAGIDSGQQIQVCCEAVCDRSGQNNACYCIGAHCCLVIITATSVSHF